MFEQYYNPYMTSRSTLPLLSRVRNINWGNLLNNTQKTLNVINQAIPIVNQVKPMVNNAKTMFRVMKEINTVDTKETKNQYDNSINELSNNNVKKEVINKPQFYI